MGMSRYKRIKINGEGRDRHRIIMEEHLGRKLTFNEVVDHINGNPKDDRLSNLRIMNRSNHSRMHYLRGEMKWNSKEAMEKKARLNKLKRLPHTKNEFTCSCCRKLKHKKMFHKNNFKWNGLNSVCIDCNKKNRNADLV